MADALDGTVSTIDQRLARHLLRKLRRASGRSAVKAAVAAGILEKECAVSSGREIGVFAPGFAAKEVSGAVIRRILQKGRHQESPSNLGLLIEDGEITLTAMEVEDMPDRDARAKAEPGDGDIGSVSGQNDTFSAAASMSVASLVALVRNSAESLRAPETATMLLLAQGIANSQASLGDVLAMLRLGRPIVTVRSEVPGFEEVFIDLLEHGHILPGEIFFSNGYELHRRSNAFQLSSANDCRWRVLCFAGREQDDDKVNWRVGLAAQTPYPILGLAEGTHGLPERLVMAANLNLDCGGFNAEIVSATIEAVLGEAPREALEPRHYTGLGLADLALAVRPGTSASRAIAVLRAIAEARWKAVADEDDEESDGNARRKMGDAKRPVQRPNTKSDRNTKPDPSSDLIEPVPLTGDGDKDRYILRVETLSGYGEARDWALAIRDDLDLWRSGEIGWEDMVVKLLLSGPPGTGKTTFAKALCNTLGIPLIASSVARWLEGGHLGDVLKRMNKTFEEAERHRPSILFIDEVDGIGHRGRTSRAYDDYWTTVVNKLLELLDGAVETQGVIIVGAANNPAVIDRALLRSGRLETHIEIPKPDTDALVGIFRHHLKDDLAAVIASAPEELKRAVQPG